jgi:N-acetylglucosaminyldiphosphoundecaprenol N-acetyl-beta-D-mannosaminyltransferase
MSESRETRFSRPQTRIMSEQHLRILDVSIDLLSPAQLRKACAAVFTDVRKRVVWIVTANPEILLAAHRDASYRSILHRATYRVADGIGIVLAGLIQGKKVARITGGFFLEMLFSLAAQHNKSIHVVLHANGLTRENDLRQSLKEHYPTIRLFVSSLAPKDPPATGVGDIVIVTFGAPMQETWIATYKNRFPDARCFVGVGGALDVFCGVLPRPPRAMSFLGLEWLWRLVIQPKRWRRILRAVFVFPITVVFHRKRT